MTIIDENFSQSKQFEALEQKFWKAKNEDRRCVDLIFQMLSNKLPKRLHSIPVLFNRFFFFGSCLMHIYEWSDRTA